VPYQVTISDVIHGVPGGTYNLQVQLNDASGAVVATSPVLVVTVPSDAPPAAPVADMPTAVIV
jgi:hypothetical protein